jgi:hypothetical protein
MSLHVLLAALVFAVLPALVRPAPSVTPLTGRPRWRTRLQEFWNQQLHLHQLYLNSFAVSGGDALDALARRTRSVRAPD